MRTKIHVQVRQEYDQQGKSYFTWSVGDKEQPVSNGRCSTYDNAFRMAKNALNNYDAKLAAGE